MLVLNSGNELAEARWGLHLNSISLGTNGFLMACHERGSVTSSPGAWQLTLLMALPQIQTAWHPATCLFPHQKAAFPPSPDNWAGHGWRRSVHWRGRHSLQARSSSPTGLSLVHGGEPLPFLLLIHLDLCKFSQ